MSEKELRLVEVPTGDRIDLGMSGRLQEGMTAASANPDVKGMTGSGIARPTAPPPKPADAGMSVKPKDS